MKYIIVTMSLIFLHGCKLYVTANPGGEVRSSSGQYYCHTNGEEWDSCNINVSEVPFNETFTAHPLPGFKFLSWAKGVNHLCWGRKNACALSTNGLENNSAFIGVLKSSQEFYLRAIFIRDHNDRSNPYAEYNGVWRFNISPSVHFCTNGRSQDVPAYSFDMRLIVHPSGRAEIVYEKYGAELFPFDSRGGIPPERTWTEFEKNGFDLNFSYSTYTNRYYGSYGSYDQFSEDIFLDLDRTSNNIFRGEYSTRERYTSADVTCEYRAETNARRISW